MNNEYIKNFYSEINKEKKDYYKIIVQPNRIMRETWIEYDKVKWELEDGIQKLVNKLLNDKTFTLEEKILKVYEYICLNYIYDANVLYFFKRDDSDKDNIKYIAVDWYGRIVGQDWINNRKKHNRRVCYEFARIFAKAISEILNGNEKMEAFMLGDRNNLHYVVGLSGEEYSAILDLDDFNSIKDLTRVKLGLTIKGIKIISDKTGTLKRAVDNFNENRKEELPEVEEAKKSLRDNDIIKYFDNVLHILKKYNIDSQGFFEYMRAIIENTGLEIEKIWKEDKRGLEKRYERCIIFEFNEETYLIDSIEQTLEIINRNELNRKLFIFNSNENEYFYYGG